MKSLAILDGQDELILSTPSRQDSRFTSIAMNNSTCGLFVMFPEDLLKLRDWINERVRELQFHGHLPDQHLGD